MCMSAADMAEALVSLACGEPTEAVARRFRVRHWEFMHEVMLAEFFGLRAWAVFGSEQP